MSKSNSWNFEIVLQSHACSHDLLKDIARESQEFARKRCRALRIDENSTEFKEILVGAKLCALWRVKLSSLKFHTFA